MKRLLTINALKTAGCVGLTFLLMSLSSPASGFAQDTTQPSLEDRAKGESALAEARRHMVLKHWGEAEDDYMIALALMPGNAEAQEGGEEARRMQDEGTQIDDVERDLQAQNQRAHVEYDADIRQASELLVQGAYSEAANVALTARIRLNRDRQFLNEGEFRTMADDAEMLIDQINEAREQERIEEAEQARRLVDEQNQIEAQNRQRERQRMIDENIRRVRQLQMELKYDEALQVLEQTLFIDEHNTAALALKEVIVALMLYRQSDDIRRAKDWSYTQQWMGGHQSSIAPSVNYGSRPGLLSTNAILQYPRDWAELSLRRTSEGGWRDTMADQRVFQVIDDVQVPIDFSGNSFEQVIGYFKQVTGLNIYVDWRALETIGIDRDDPVSLQLTDVPIRTAIQRVMEQVGDDIDRPQWTVRDGMLTVSSKSALNQRVATVVYDIRDLLFEVPYFDNAPSLDLDSALNQGLGGGGGNGGGGFGGGGGGGGGRGGGGGGGGGSIFDEPGDADRVDREQLVEQIVTIIQDTIDPEGWRDLGGDVGTLQELNGNLIIANTPRNHRSIEGLLSQLREIRALQINVESRFLAVSNEWFEQIGVDLDLFFNTNNTLRQQQLAADPTGALSDFFFDNGQLKEPLIFGNPSDVSAFDPTVGQIANTVPFGNFFGTPTGTLVNGFEQTAYSAGPVGAPLRTTSGFSPIAVIQDSLDLVSQIADLDPTSMAGLAAANPALVTGFKFLDDIEVHLLIEATQADKRSVILTAPRLTFFNGQRSWVAVNTQTAFVSALIPITGDSSGAFQPIIATLTDGFVLDVEGVISSDRRYVTMTVIASQSEFLGFRESDAAEFGGAAGGGGVGGGAAAQFTGQVELPVIQVALVQTTVSVPDKGTILLGGQRTVDEIETETGVPVLSKIPFINRFFTNRLTSKVESTLLIMIRPEIIITQENEDQLFPGLIDRLGGSSSFSDFGGR